MAIFKREPSALRESQPSGTIDNVSLSRRGVFTAIGLGMAAAGLAGCAPAAADKPTVTTSADVPSPSSGNTIKSPEMTLEEIFEADFDTVIKPLTQEQLYPQTNPKFLPDYIAGASAEDLGHRDEIPELFAIHLNPEDFKTDDDFVKAYVKEWFDRENAMYQVGTGGYSGNNLGDRTKDAVAMYTAMTSGRQKIDRHVLRDVEITTTEASICRRMAAGGVASKYPLAIARIPSMDSVRYTGNRETGFDITIKHRRLHKVDTGVIAMDIGPGTDEYDGISLLHLKGVKVDPGTHRVSAASSWDPYTDRI